jgi:hypothetical protein
MLQQSPNVDMMDCLGGWRQLKFFYEIFIRKKSVQKLPQKWLINLGSDPSHFRKHLFDIPRRLWKKVVELDFFLLALSQFQDTQLERSLKFINFAPHLDKIIRFEEGGKIYGVIPHPPINFSCAVSETEREVRVTALRFCQGLFSDEEGVFYGLAPFELVDEYFGHVFLLSWEA